MYAVVNRYRDARGLMTVRHVYTGFTSKTKAKKWNLAAFPQPEMNYVVPVSHFSELDLGA